MTIFRINTSLKIIFPKGLRGRTLLILLFPVIMIQLIIAGVFVQRHHDRVTRQMVANVRPYLQAALVRIASASDIEEAEQLVRPVMIAGTLGVSISEVPDGPPTDQRIFYDFSGAILIDSIRQAIGNVQTVDLLASDGYRVVVRVETALGQAKLSFNRSSVSPSNPHQLLVLMVFTGILLTAIASIFLRNQLKPIIRLAKASKAFGKGEHIELSPAGATEVREATRAFLEMRNRIETHIEQRTQMLSSISHDLKTPLARLRVGIELLDHSSETRELIDDVNLMNQMVQNFLEFTRSQKLESKVKVNAKSFIENICRDAHLPNQHLELVIDESVHANLSFSVRPVSTRRAVQNLIQNAFHYGNTARLSVSVSNRMLCFIVEDDGPGIPTESRSLAVRPFSRLDTARNLSHAGGVGLGLAIATDIATSQGGTLELADSECLGGLEATIALPLSDGGIY